LTISSATYWKKYAVICTDGVAACTGKNRE